MNLWIWIGFLSTLAQISSFTWGMRAAGGVWYAEKSQYLCMISGPIYLPITNINTTQINSISSFYFILPSQHKVMSKAERCWAIRGKSSDVFFLKLCRLFILFIYGSSVAAIHDRASWPPGWHHGAFPEAVWSFSDAATLGKSRPSQTPCGAARPPLTPRSRMCCRTWDFVETEKVAARCSDF